MRETNKHRIQSYAPGDLGGTHSSGLPRTVVRMIIVQDVSYKVAAKGGLDPLRLRATIWRVVPRVTRRYTASSEAGCACDDSESRTEERGGAGMGEMCMGA